MNNPAACGGVVHRHIAREVYYILKKRNNLINSIQIAA